MNPDASPFEFATMQGFFPTPVWVFDLPGDRAQPLNARLRGELEALLAPLPDIPAGATWQSEQTLHTVPEFAELVALIHDAAQEVIRELQVDGPGLEITGCWANINPRGSAHKAHTHPNNYLSGVYYLKVPDGAGTLSFHDPRSQANQMVPPALEPNALNAISQSLAVHEGRMVLFPAWLPHSVVPNPSGDVRISVSFNLMFTDFSARMGAPLWKGLPLKRARPGGA